MRNRLGADVSVRLLGTRDHARTRPSMGPTLGEDPLTVPLGRQLRSGRRRPPQPSRTIGTARTMVWTTGATGTVSSDETRPCCPAFCLQVNRIRSH